MKFYLKLETQSVVAEANRRINKNRPQLVFIILFMLLTALAATAQNQTLQREVAVTFDDLPASHGNLTQMTESNRNILKVFLEHKIPAVGFVNEAKLYVKGETDERIELLRMWVDAGLELGNHTFSHILIDQNPLSAYKDDVIRGETVTSKLLAEKKKKLRYFRHTQLRTGPTAEYQAGLNEFLAARGYIIAPVTIDNQEWVFAGAYAGAKRRGDEAEMKRIGEAYIKYMDETFDFFEKLSKDFLNYEVKQTLLLHVNDINGDYFEELVQMMQQRGYKFISLEEALKDSAYKMPEAQSTRGLSWIHRWMLAKGLKLREEPREPKWVADLHAEYLRRQQATR
jgi:peptidoglycan-N-acetylglucosamine deacetylase